MGLIKLWEKIIDWLFGRNREQASMWAAVKKGVSGITAFYNGKGYHERK